LKDGEKMAYSIHEIFYTLQGEGGQTGRAAVFCRFAGCNLWSGKEEDRATASCRFCDTDFVGTHGVRGGRYTPETLVSTLLECWPHHKEQGLVVFTGGEPLLQLDENLVAACHNAGFEVAVETNGTRNAPSGIDWLCVSPKPRSEWKLQKGTELKLIYPQDEPEMHPNAFEDWEFSLFFLQPKDGPNLQQNIQAAIKYCQENPLWRLSLQTHKIVGLP